jgi:hypothetical protein
LDTITRQHVLGEIRRTAALNGNIPLGSRSFEQLTGIRSHEWQRFWPRFSEAQQEAGFEPNKRKAAIPDHVMLEKLALLTRAHGHRPTIGELRIAKRSDPAIPSIEAFLRLGDFEAITERLRIFATEREEFADIIELLPAAESASDVDSADDECALGFVYLMKMNRNYKIGRTNSTGRREYELALQLPEKASLIHEIKTDDPVGIEKYWHSRFAEKRLNGEWFALAAADVSAFRRRKFMQADSPGPETAQTLA